MNSEVFQRGSSMKLKLCPCCSGKDYSTCCKPLHIGQPPENALALMRSRYSAYAKQLARYIIDTTHRENLHYKQNRQEWIQDIVLFCRNTKFEGLEIVEFIDGAEEAYVTFIAHLEQNKIKSAMQEKSIFKKEQGRWLYYGQSDN